tara:strand:- start:8107 stop:8433 length:327 start_codon:yes stop_codon:yes gene_type:complete
MPCTTANFIAGDTLSSLRIRIFDDEAKVTVPLFGIYTALLVWKIDNLATMSRPMTVLPAPDDGFVQYTFAAGELIEGIMLVQVRLTEISSGDVVTTNNTIRKIIGPTL